MAAVAKRYAKALFEVAKERGELDQAAQELGRLASMLREHADLAQFLHHPVVPKQAKLEILEQVFQGQLSPGVYRLAQILIERDRLKELDRVAQAYVEEVNKERGLVEAVVSTAVPLTEEQQEHLKQTLAKLTAKEVHLISEVNPEMLGGMTVKIGDIIFDGSLKNKLSRFEHILASAKS